MFDDLEKFLSDIGVVAETALAFFRFAKRSGADDNEAYLVTKAFLSSMIDAGEQDKKE